MEGRDETHSKAPVSYYHDLRDSMRVRVQRQTYIDLQRLFAMHGKITTSLSTTNWLSYAAISSWIFIHAFIKLTIR